MKKAAIIGVILEDPQKSQEKFNNIVSEYHEILIGRMGIPFNNGDTALISLTVASDSDTINTFTKRIGDLDDVVVNTSIVKKKIELE